MARFHEIIDALFDETDQAWKVTEGDQLGFPPSTLTSADLRADAREHHLVLLRQFVPVERVLFMFRSSAYLRECYQRRILAHRETLAREAGLPVPQPTVIQVDWGEAMAEVVREFLPRHFQGPDTLQALTTMLRQNLQRCRPGEETPPASDD